MNPASLVQVDSLTESSIVDCDVLEAAKENVQPLGTGRRVTTLSAVLATPHAQRESKLLATRNKLRINAELAMEDEDGDPLDAYCRLVYWTVENYPQGSSVESGLLELLEEATRVLKDDRDGKWRGDLKYLKLWLLYASFVERPTLIYNFLIANEIGTEFSLLYEEYAAVLERDGRRKDADDAYVLGIARRASPLHHLKARYDDFQKRMMSNTLSLPTTTPNVASEPARPVLVTSSRSTSSGLAASRSSTSMLSSSSSHSSSNTALQIFVDPTGSESQQAESSGNTWTELGTRKGRIKENVPETKKMAGSKLKQPGRSKRIASNMTTSASKIAIYRDPVVDEAVPASVTPKTPSKEVMPPSTPGQGAPGANVAAATGFLPFRDSTTIDTAPLSAPGSVMKPKTTTNKIAGPVSEMEALRKDPLKNYADVNMG